MVIVNIFGGIGNQLFQYAAARNIAEYHQVALKYHFEDHYKLAQRKFSLDLFSLDFDQASPDELKIYKPIGGIKRRINMVLGRNYNGKAFREKKHFNFDSSIYNTSDEIYLIGFWQNLNYFVSITDILRKELSFTGKLSYQSEVNKSQIEAEEQSVSLHIRRGDYTIPASGFNVLANIYYEQAIAYLNKYLPNAKFFVFTDDPSWCINHYKNYNNFIVIERNFQKNDWEDLYLMSRCKHNIIANSSFSWWGAWLNPNPNKKVVSPKIWTNDPNVNTDELIPHSWIRL